MTEVIDMKEVRESPEAVAAEMESKVTAAIDTAATMCNALLSNLVHTYWNLGEIISELDTAYGKNAIKKFAAGLSVKIGRAEEFHETSLYRFRSFYNKFNTLDVNTIVDTKISWTQVVKVLPEDVSIEAIRGCLKRVKGGEIQPTEFSDAVLNTIKQLGKRDIGPIADPDDDEPGEAPESGDGEEAAPRQEKPAAAKTLDQRITAAISVIQACFDTLGDVVMLADGYKQLKTEEKADHAKNIDELIERMKSLSTASKDAAKRLASAQ